MGRIVRQIRAFSPSDLLSRPLPNDCRAEIVQPGVGPVWEGRRVNGVWLSDPRNGHWIQCAGLEKGAYGWDDVGANESAVVVADGLRLAPSDNATAAFELTLFHDEGGVGRGAIKIVEVIADITAPGTPAIGHNFLVGVAASAGETYDGEYSRVGVEHDGAHWDWKRYWANPTPGNGVLVNDVPVGADRLICLENPMVDVNRGFWASNYGTDHDNWDAAAQPMAAVNLSRPMSSRVALRCYCTRPSGGEAFVVVVKKVRVYWIDPT